MRAAADLRHAHDAGATVVRVATHLATRASADLVWCAHVVRHQPDPVSALLDLSLLLSDDGVLAIAEGRLAAASLLHEVK